MKLKNITNGIITENPTFVQLLGMCPTLAVTVSAKNGFGMGMATTAVLMMSNVVISALRKVIPAKIRIPAFIVVIASAVTIISMLMETYVNGLYEVLGLFIPLIVVNCIILARAEAYAFENKVFDSLLDGLGMGLGFTMSLTILGIVREFFGEFKFFGTQLFEGESMLIMIQPPGAFLTLALLLALYNQAKLSKERKVQRAADAKRKAEKEAEEAAAKAAEEERERKRLEREKQKAEAEAKKAAEEAAAKAEEADAEPVQEQAAKDVKEEPAPQAEKTEDKAEEAKASAAKAEDDENKAE